MLVIGLLSTKQEVQEIQYIARIFKIEDRIKLIVRKQKLKDMMGQYKDI